MNTSNITKLVIALILLSLAIIAGFFIFGSSEIGTPNANNNLLTPKSTNDNSSPSYKTLQVGTHAPDFSVSTVDGEKLSLQDFKGKILVLTSGAAWCPTCIIENKNFNPVYQELNDKGVEFMTVDIDPIDSEEAVLEFQRLYAPWHNVIQANAKKMIEDYGFWRFEITYIIDREGIVRFSDLGITETETLREELNKII